MRISGKVGPCRACGAIKCAKGFEDAHIVSHGMKPGKNKGNGCDCKINLIRLCWHCHRMVVHGVNGGWHRLLILVRVKSLALYLSLNISIQRAQEHHWARERGETECSRNLKRGALARQRIQKTEGGNQDASKPVG